MKNILPKITLKNFSPGKSGAGQVLGELQTAVMETLWRESDLTVTEVEQRLQKNREIAHTTVSTILDRMHQKGFLLRKKQGKAFVYSPHFSKEEFERAFIAIYRTRALGVRRTRRRGWRKARSARRFDSS